jgi:hypothetical protein
MHGSTIKINAALFASFKLFTLEMCPPPPPPLCFKNIHHLSTALFGARPFILRKVDYKYLESCEIWCWRRMEETSWTDRVRNEEVLTAVKEERNVVHTVK